MPIRNALVSLVATAPIWCATAASLGSVLYAPGRTPDRVAMVQVGRRR